MPQTWQDPSLFKPVAPPSAGVSWQDPQAFKAAPAEPDAPPSTTSRIVSPTLHLPTDLWNSVKALAEGAVDPQKRQAIGEGIVNNLIDHVKAGAAMMQDPKSHVLWGAERMAGGLPVIGPLMDATADRDIPKQIGEGVSLGVQGLVGAGAAKAIEAAPAAAAAWRAERATAAGAQKLSSFQQSIPPSRTVPYTPADVDRAMPYLATEHATEPIASVVGMRDAADTAIGKIETTISEAIVKNPADKIPSFPDYAAKRALRTNVRTDFYDAGMKELEKYKLRDLTLEEADATRRQMNADNKAVLKKNNYDVTTARATDPAFAAREAAAEALRDGIYTVLENRGLAGARNLRLDEGALIKIRNAATSKEFAGTRSVGGTGQNGVVRQVLAKGVTAAAAGTGAAIAGPGGAAAGSIVGQNIANRLASPNLTRDQLMARAFGGR